MTQMVPYPTPSRSILENGRWVCVGAGVVTDLGITGPICLYRANTGPLYVGLDTQGAEGWFGRGQIHKVVRLWARIDGVESWLHIRSVNTLPPPIATAVTDSNHAKRSTDVAKAVSGEETAVRTTMNVAHAIGGIAATMFGAGALVPVIGDLEKQGLDALYPRK